MAPANPVRIQNDLKGVGYPVNKLSSPHRAERGGDQPRH